MKSENELRRQMFLQARKEQEKRDLDRIKKLLEASYIISCVSTGLFGEAEEILERNKLVLDNEITKKQKAFLEASDIYCKEFASMIKTDLEKRNFWDDCQVIDKKFRRWAGLNNADIIEWHEVGKRLPKVGEKVIVVTRNGKYALSEIDTDKRWKGSGSFADSIVAWREIEKYKE